MNLGSIWDRFGSIWGLGRIFGGFGAPLSAQDRILIDFKLVLGPLVGPSRPQLGGLEPSWGVLWLSWGSRESFYFRSHFRSIFGLHFASILDPKTTPKSLKNQTKSFAKTKKEKDLFRCFFHWNFKRFWCWSQKGRSSKTMQKHSIFVHFLNMCLCRQRTETFWKPMQKSITNQSQNRGFFVEILIVFGIDVRTRNFEVLGSILASISASIWGQVGRLGASWDRLGGVL